MSNEQIKAALEAAEAIITTRAPADERAIRVAIALRWLTDTTTLTWELVCKEPGITPEFDGGGVPFVSLGNDHTSVFCMVENGVMHWTQDGADMPLPPRTLGELRQTILRVSS